MVYDVKPPKLRVIMRRNTPEEMLTTMVEIENSEKALMEYINSGDYKSTDWMGLSQVSPNPKIEWDSMYMIKVSHDNGPELVFGYCDRRPGDATQPFPTVTIPEGEMARAMRKYYNGLETAEGIT